MFAVLALERNPGDLKLILQISAANIDLKKSPNDAYPDLFYVCINQQRDETELFQKISRV